jgi:putative colanic acid biosynthesis UDP-glucose lipid carrier transferase
VNQVARPPARVVAAALRRISLSYQSLQAIAAGFDMCVLVLASVLGFILYQYFLTSQLVSPNDGLGVGVVAGALFVVLSRSRGLYEIQALLAPARHFSQVLSIVAITCLALVYIMFLLKVGSEYSRGSMIAFGVLAFVFVPFGRQLFARASAVGIQTGVIIGRRAVTLGEASELERLAPPELRRFGIEELARIGLIQSDKDRGLGQGARTQIAGAIALARQLDASEFVLLVPWAHGRLLAEITELLRRSPLPVKLLPDHTIRNVISRQLREGPNAYLAVEIQREPLSRWERFAKRALDLALSFSAVVLLTPLLLIIGLAIKLESKGPALFRQRRCGFDDREFVIFKFRTMTALDDGEDVLQARRGDARVTRLGRLLRRSSIDELPQLLNVIRGDMSLVGPRPHAVAHNDQYRALISSYALRHHVKPGLTGMAQIRGLRGETHELALMEQRVEQDLWYINHWSLTLDLIIMARTCLVVLRQDAY